MKLSTYSLKQSLYNKEILMTYEQHKAFVELTKLSEGLRRLIVQARSAQQPLTLPETVISKLNESLQALFAAQRLMEKECLVPERQCPSGCCEASEGR